MDALTDRISGDLRISEHDKSLPSSSWHPPRPLAGRISSTRTDQVTSHPQVHQSDYVDRSSLVPARASKLLSHRASSDAAYDTDGGLMGSGHLPKRFHHIS